jgi:hypothetical protein
VVILLALFVGCAHPLDISALNRSKPSTILLVIQPDELFMIPHPGAEGFDDALRRGYFSDPLPKIGVDVASKFAKQHGLTLQVITERRIPPAMGQAGHNSLHPLPPPPPPPPRASADLTLEVRTASWGLGTRELFDGDAFVYYSADVDLIDNRSHAVIASGACQSQPRNKPTVNYIGFLQGWAMILRDLESATAQCIRDFGKVLRTESPATPTQTALPGAFSK